MTSAESTNYAKRYLQKAALRELIAIRGDVEYGTALVTLARAEPLVRRAQTLVAMATQIVHPGH
ncbi:hypothetical protein [Nocardioides sp. B-3]|uniref:hypothetical protein n=1 Tax=Nocardioides sp. B-3 TaxID=2895565 RepID=UPI002152BFC5|nr:hypothetical protein [Nocardioides sp. B-3]UUZ58692.1 hypothetical protein LP418_21645 [Nocardioides sp. B-3]